MGADNSCAACDATRANLPRTGILHSPGCRERIEAAVAADPRRMSRYAAAQDRIEAARAADPSRVDKRPAGAEADTDREATRARASMGAAATSSSCGPQESMTLVVKREKPQVTETRWEMMSCLRSPSC